MLYDDVFYDLGETSLTDRESFNNTLVLLSLVKSRYYYVIGFSRPKNMILVGFDFRLPSGAVITERLAVCFGASEDNVVLSCVLANLPVPPEKKASLLLPENGRFRVGGKRVRYKMLVPKDKVYPVTGKTMNRFLLSAKKEIGSFLEANYSRILFG